MKKLKSGTLYFSIIRDDNKYADQYVKVVVSNNRKYSSHANLIAILSDRVKTESDRGLFFYGLYEYSDLFPDKPEVIGVDMV